jgi:glycine betaine/proline transport system ATP-binding protein
MKDGQTFQTQLSQEGQAIESLAQKNTRIAPTPPCGMPWRLGTSPVIACCWKRTDKSPAPSATGSYNAMLGKQLDDT